jgi:hypothetical protein
LRRRLKFNKTPEKDIRLAAYMRKALKTGTEFLKLQIFELENKIKESGFCC